MFIIVHVHIKYVLIVSYWPVWARQVGVLLQQTALLVVPVAAFVQTWRYMSKGPPDILEVRT